ncbi:hypothetical protein LCGC14_2983820 [marine sediment metagenome]|uniref:Transglycosylase SLT domain-containing protein n=1 Tax=marine sediment metagenome TaxID=412755 RepID=A0A0F8X5U8_9ZZZZ
MALYKKAKRVINLILFLGLLTLLFYFSYQFIITRAYPLRHKSQVIKASQKHDVDKWFDEDSVSKKGAVGLMQLMPKTARWISQQQGVSFNKNQLFSAKTNIDYGTWYIGYLQKRYKNRNLALAAYNSGTTIVDRWLAKHPEGNVNEFSYPETRNFVARVNISRRTYMKIYDEESFE